MERVGARGIFLYEGARKFFARGVSYGPFRSNLAGEPLPEKDVVERDLALLRRADVNTLRVYHVPPSWFVDLVRSFGMRVLVGIPWAQHIRFLDSAQECRRIRERIRESARRFQEDPAILAHLIGNEISPELVRWYGRENVQRFLAELADEVRQVDPEALVSYANFPMTEYLELGFLDFQSFNVYLHRDDELRAYVRRLQNLASPKPLMVTEFGIDSMREGDEEQAIVNARTCRSLGDLGVSGSFVFSYTDEWFTGGHDIEDWAFGLVDRNREPKPAYHAVADVYSQPMSRVPEDAPRVSVVVCAYNAERTMDECLESLQHLTYPDYEVIVVDDGSTDGTRAIAERYPEFRLISHENRGLSAARNEGIEAATGEIVAYTDSDCAVDPDWLNHLVSTLLETHAAGVGGPNLPPAEAHWMPELVAHLPGGPTHVLLHDDEAEHVPGCNMAFWRERLLEIGGFDPIFRTAGDDVDLCWRLQDRGHRVGFAPAALVWHRRRHTAGAYLKQQRGYGHAEALLQAKHPDRCHEDAGARWHGRIYDGTGSAARAAGGVVYGGVFGTAFFQTLYASDPGHWHHLPRTLEWTTVAVVVLLAGAVGLSAGGSPALLAIGAALASIGPAQALRTALKLPIQGAPRVRGRLLAAALTFLGPVLRGWERRSKQLIASPTPEAYRPHPRPRIDWRHGTLLLSFWNETGVGKEACLGSLLRAVRALGQPVVEDDGWRPFDAALVGGWTRGELKLLVQNHGADKRQVDVGLRLRRSRMTAVLGVPCGIGLCAAGALGAWAVAAGFAAALIGLGLAVARDARRLAHVLQAAAPALEAHALESMEPGAQRGAMGRAACSPT